MSLSENLTTSARCLIENLVFFICQREGLSLASSLFVENKSGDSSNGLPSTLGLRGRVFKNFKLAVNSFEVLPNQLSAILKEMALLIGKRDLESFFSRGIERLAEQLNFSTRVDKRAEKNFLSLVRNKARESLKTCSSSKSLFYSILNIVLTDLGYLFVFTPEEEKIEIILVKIALDTSKDPEIKKFLQEALTHYSSKKSFGSMNFDSLIQFTKLMRY